LYAVKSAARAIRQRTKSTLWHDAQTDAVDETEQDSYVQSNDNHPSFTSTLQRTLDLLQPYISNRSADQPDGEPGPAASLEEVTNRFSKLEMEELADQDLEEPTKRATSKPATPSRVTYIVNNGDEERGIAMNFLLSDYSRIKSVYVTCHEYFNSKTMDLITAAATTQAAMQIIRGLVHDFGILFPQISMMEALCLEYLRQNKHVIQTEPETTVSEYPLLQLP
jgi:hypothetical protein